MRIPQYNSTVDVNNLPDGYLHISPNADSFGAAEGQGMTAFGQAGVQTFAGITDIAAREKRVIENAYAQDAYLKAHAKIQEKLNTDILQRKGLNVQGAVDEIAKHADSVFDEVSADLPSNSKAILGARLGQYKNTVVGMANNHAAGELTKSNDERNAALVMSYTDDAAADYNNPETIQKSKEGIIAVNMTEKRTKGLPDEVANIKLQQQTTMMHNSVIDRMLANKEITKADAYYKANVNEIDPTMRGKIEKELSTLNDIELAHAKTMEYNADPKYVNDRQGAIDSVDNDSALTAFQKENVKKSLLASWHTKDALKVQQTNKSCLNIQSRIYGAKDATEANNILSEAAVRMNVSGDPTEYKHASEAIAGKFGSELENEMIGKVVQIRTDIEAGLYRGMSNEDFSKKINGLSPKYVNELSKYREDNTGLQTKINNAVKLVQRPGSYMTINGNPDLFYAVEARVRVSNDPSDANVKKIVADLALENGFKNKPTKFKLDEVTTVPEQFKSEIRAVMNKKLPDITDDKNFKDAELEIYKALKLGGKANLDSVIQAQRIKQADINIKAEALKAKIKEEKLTKNEPESFVGSNWQRFNKNTEEVNKELKRIKEQNIERFSQ